MAPFLFKGADDLMRRDGAAPCELPQGAADEGPFGMKGVDDKGCLCVGGGCMRDESDA